MLVPQRPGPSAGLVRLRLVVLLTVAAIVGVAIARVDSRPSWDDTGITVAVIALASAVLAGIAGRRPWLFALLVGAPTPLLELATGGSSGSLAALLFAAAGATIGWLAARSQAEAERR
jgi:hypothetical protein